MNSVSPRFSELEKLGALVRIFIGYGRPTSRFPKGAPRFITRRDDETGRNVNVYWLPEFAPTARVEASASNQEEPQLETLGAESRGSEDAA